MTNYDLRQMSDEELTKNLYATIAEKARVLRVLGERSRVQAEKLRELITRINGVCQGANRS